MAARVLDASNVSMQTISGTTGQAPYSVNYSDYGESNGLGPKGGNADSSCLVGTTSGVESGLRAILGTAYNVSSSTDRGCGAYFVAPRCTGATSSNIDIRDTSDGRTHTTVDKVHCTWRMSIQTFSSSVAVAHYNFVPLGVYDTSGTLIAGIRLQHRGEMYALYLDPYLGTGSKPGDMLLGQLRSGLGTQDTEHAPGDSTAGYMTVELVVDTTLSSPSSDSVRAAARIVLPTGQAQPWVVATWDASDNSTSANACDSWQFWSSNRDGTTNRPNYEPYVKIDSYHHVDGSDWWSNYDTHGVGYDGFGHGVKIVYLAPTSDVLVDTPSGWTKSTGSTAYGVVDETPVSYGDYLWCNTNDKRVVFGLESFLTKAGWTASPYGEVLGVVAKVAASIGTTDYYYGTNIRVGLCDGSNNTYTQGSGVSSYAEVCVANNRQMKGVYSWGVNEKPAGGAWDPSSIDTDLRLWLQQGPAYGSALKYSTIYGAGAYVLYREPVRAVGSSSGGQGVLESAPTLTRPRVASGAGRNCARIDIADTTAPNGSTGYRWWELPTTDTNGVTNNFVFGDYSPLTGKYYFGAWDRDPWTSTDPVGAAGSGRSPCIAEVDPATGTTKIIWRADETTSGGSATDGGPHSGSSGSWYWPTDGADKARSLRIHFLKIDKRPKFLDGTTNPFYGHIFCSFADNGLSSGQYLYLCGTLWVDPSQARTGDYCYARWLAWPDTPSYNYSRGAYGVAITEDYAYFASPWENGTNHGIIHRFNKKNFAAGSDWSGGTVGSGYPIQTPASDWDTSIDTGTSTSTSALQHAINQLYYLGGKVWSTGAVVFGFTPGDSANGDTGGTVLGPWALKAGNATLVREFNTRQLTMHPATGNLWGVGQWAADGATTANSRIKDWLETYENSGSRTGCYGNDTVGVFEMNPSTGDVLRYWRVPLEITDDSLNATAAKQGSWRSDLWGDSMSIHGCHWVDEDTLLISIGEHRTSGDYASVTEWPRSTLLVFRRSEETWHQVTKPAKNQIALCLVDVLATDRGRFSSGSGDAPPNRHDLLSLGGASPVQTPSTWDPSGLRHRYILTDVGFTRAGNATPDYYTYAADGGATSSSRGHGIEVYLRAPVLQENEVMVEAIIDLTSTSITSVDEWRMELRSGGTVGHGQIFASGGTTTAVSNKVRIRGFIQASDYKPGSTGADIDVFWAVTTGGRQYWNSRSTS